MVKNRDRRWQNVDEFLEQLTYSPPPVLAHESAPVARTVGDEPTVRFRRPAMVSADEPNARVKSTSPGGDSVKRPLPSPHVAQRERVPGPFNATSQFRRVWPLLAAFAAVAIAGLSWYALLGGRGSGAERSDSAVAVRSESAHGVTSSAGSVALDSSPPEPSRPVGDSVSGAARRGTPRPPAAPPTSSVSPAAPRRSTAATGPSARCSVPSMVDQRACLMAYVTINDASLQRVYDSLIVQMRRNANVKRPTVTRQR